MIVIVTLERFFSVKGFPTIFAIMLRSRLCDGCQVDGAIKLRNSLLVSCIKTLDLNAATGVGINDGDFLIAAIGSATRKLSLTR